LAENIIGDTAANKMLSHCPAIKKPGKRRALQNEIFD
jgi:hypothetical protein